MSYNLFLDDVRQPGACVQYMYGRIGNQSKIYERLEWIIAKDYDHFTDIITNLGLPEKVSFDHDLAAIHYDAKTWSESFQYKEKTGYDCAKFLCDFCIENDQELPEIFVHSMNPVGTENIKKLINSYEKSTRYS